MISNVIEPQYRGAFMSLNSSFQQLFVGSASFIAGLIVTNDAAKRIYNYNWVGYLSMVIILFCVYLGVQLNKRMLQKGI